MTFQSSLSDAMALIASLAKQSDYRSQALLEESRASLSFLISIIGKAQRGDISETLFKQCLRAFLSKRFHAIKDKPYRYDLYPQSAINQAAVYLARQFKNEDEATVSLLMPTVTQVIGGTMGSLYEDTEMGGAFDPRDFLLDETGTRLIYITNVLEYAESNPVILLGREALAPGRIFQLSPQDITQLKRLNPYIHYHLNLIEQKYQLLSRPDSFIHALTWLNIMLYRSSSDVDGTEDKAKEEHLGNALKQMLKVYRRLESQDQLGELDKFVITTDYPIDKEEEGESTRTLSERCQRTLRQVLLYIMTYHHVTVDELSLAEKAIWHNKYKLYPCSLNLSTYLSGVLLKGDFNALINVGNQNETLSYHKPATLSPDLLRQRPFKVNQRSTTQTKNQSDYLTWLTSTLKVLPAMTQAIETIHQEQDIAPTMLQALMQRGWLIFILEQLGAIERGKIIKSLTVNEIYQLFHPAQGDECALSFKVKADKVMPGLYEWVCYRKGAGLKSLNLENDINKAVGFLDIASIEESQTCLSSLEFEDKSMLFNLFKNLQALDKKRQFVLYCLKKGELGNLIKNQAYRLTQVLKVLSPREKASFSYHFKSHFHQCIHTKTAFINVYHLIPLDLKLIFLIQAQPTSAWLSHLHSVKAKDRYLEHYHILEQKQKPMLTALQLLDDYLNRGWLSRLLFWSDHRNPEMVILVQDYAQSLKDNPATTALDIIVTLIENIQERFPQKSLSEFEHQSDFFNRLHIIAALAGVSLENLFLLIARNKKEIQETPLTTPATVTLAN